MGVDSVPVAPGDIVVALAWSNVATTMHVNLNFLRKLPPGDKSPEVITLSTNDFATGSNRAVTSGTLTIPFEGTITGLSGVGISGGGTQRGQTFVNVLLTRAGTSITVVQTLAQDYFYTGNTLTLGQVVEPGPAGGHGAITRVTKAATAVPAGGLVLAVVPTGAIWKWSMGSTGSYTATATAGTRAARFQFRDASGNVYMVSNNLAPTLSQVGIFELAQNLTSDTTVLIGGNVAIESPAPMGPMIAGFDLTVKDFAATDVADTCSLEGQVEEWVMPN